MWHNVLVVHYPVDILYLLVDIFGKMRVADPGRAEVVHLDAQLRQQSPYLDSGYRCQGCTQTVPSCQHLCTWVFTYQGFEVSQNALCHCFVIFKESLVDFAFIAVLVRDFIESEIFDPVLYVGRSPVGYDYQIFGGRIADVSGSPCDHLHEVLYISQHLPSPLTRPRLNAFLGTVGEDCEINVIL